MKKNKCDEYCEYPAALVYDLVQKNSTSAEKGGIS
jgi:hypothetical protein